MKRRFLLTLASAAAMLVCALGFAACGEEAEKQQTPPPASNEPALNDITGVTFADKTVTYDGTEHSVTVSGTLPEGVSVAYTDNAKTNAGTYDAQAVLSGANYVTKTLNATLTINKATIPDSITLTDSEEKSDGNPHSLEVAGTLPEGVSVSYTYNGVAASSVTAKGTYEVVATLSGSNYVTKTLTATLTLNWIYRNLPKAFWIPFSNAPSRGALFPRHSVPKRLPARRRPFRISPRS